MKNAASRFAWVAVIAAAAALSSIPVRAEDHPHDWPMYQHNPQRTGFNPNETKINRTSVALLQPKWVFHAGDSITASPVVVHFDDFGGAGPKKVVYVGSADESFYAIDAADGSLLWDPPFRADPAPGIGYNMFASSAYVDKARGQLYVGGGFTMYALDLITGERRWSWSTAGSEGQPAAGGGEILSSPVVVNRTDPQSGETTGTVYFGSDMDGTHPDVPITQRFPALFALDADSGELRWYWRALDAEREAQQPRCGSIWASVAVDEEEGLLYCATSDCTRSVQGRYNEAVIGLDIEPQLPLDPDRRRRDPPNWYYMPWYLDPYDVDFGSTPLLFDLDGVKVLGIGGKDGFYYVIERQRAAEPDTFRYRKWATRVVRGGFAGGFIGSTATDGKSIWGATALFDTPGGPNPLAQPPFSHSFDAASGDIRWQQVASGPTFGSVTAVPGVVFVGSTAHTITALDADTGQVLWATPALGAVSSSAAISDGEVFIGAGTKAENFGLGQGPVNALYAFALPAEVEESDDAPAKLPPSVWPFGVLQYPFPEDGSVPYPTPTPGS